MKTALSLALMVFLSLLAQSLPVSKRSNTENAGNSQQAEHFTASNESGSRYILDLFNSITNGSLSDPLTSQANTIRSLKNVAPAPGCNVFNFSLSGIGHSELAIVSNLHLYMVRKEPCQDSLTVEVRKFKQEGNGEDYITSKHILPVKEAGWLLFPLQAYVSELLPTGKTHAVVRVIVRGSNGDPLDCKDINSPISFIYSQSEQDRAPYLTLHSYDNRIEDIDYKAVLKQLETEKVDSPTVVARRRRTTNEASDPSRRACQLNELIIESHHIQLPKEMKDFVIVNPLTVNLGICGGGCANTSPKHGELKQHSLLSHYYLSSTGFQYQGGRVAQCCAPVAYKMETFMLRGPPDNKLSIVNLPNIQIAKCDCLHTIDFTASQT